MGDKLEFLNSCETNEVTCPKSPIIIHIPEKHHPIIFQLCEPPSPSNVLKTISPSQDHHTTNILENPQKKMSILSISPQYPPVIA